MATYTSSAGPKSGKIEVRKPPLQRDYVPPAMPVAAIKEILSKPTTMERFLFSKKQNAFVFHVNFDLMEIHWFDTKSNRHVGTSTCRVARVTLVACGGVASENRNPSPFWLPRHRIPSPPLLPDGRDALFSVSFC